MRRGKSQVRERSSLKNEKGVLRRDKSCCIGQTSQENEEKPQMNISVELINNQ